MQTIKYNLEWYGCFPFWTENGENIPVEALSLSPVLQQEIKDLNDYYQSLYDAGDPKNSTFPDIEAAKIFARRMLQSAENLGIELTGRYTLIFKDAYWNSLVKL